MKWTFRRLLILFAMALSLASTVALSIFFLSLYRSEKVATLFESEKANVQQVASHVESLIRLADLIDIDKVSESRDIIFVAEDPCIPGVPPRIGVSREFADHFHNLGIDPSGWANSLEVFKACQQTRAVRSTSSSLGPSLTLLPSRTQIFVPYILTLLSTPKGGHRLAMISLDGFRTTTVNTLFITRADGAPIWAADGDPYLQEALFDTEVPSTTLARAAQSALHNGSSRTEWAGTAGLLSYAPIDEGLAVMSLSYAPAILAPVHYVLLQILLLSAGVFLLCFLVGKKLAEFLTRPLQKLQLSAERIGGGNFNEEFDSVGIQEFAVVFDAFKVMRERIIQLIERAAEGVALEKQMILTQEVQKLLIPPPVTETVSHSIYGIMRPAEHVGGDWWGYVEIERTDRPPLLLIMVGDATDHGVPPALITATVRGAQSVLSMLFSSGGLEPDLPQILKWLNRTIFEAAKGSITMTLVAALFDSEKKQVTIANAGHVLPYLLGEGGLKVVQGGGDVLGQNLNFQNIPVSVLPWNPGDRLVLYSDGLTDAYDGDVNLFDRKIFSKLLRSLPKRMRGREILNRVLKERDKVASDIPQADDVTVVVCEAKR